MSEALVIPAQDLVPEVVAYRWHLDGAFFAEMGSAEILDADLDVAADVSDDGDVEVSCTVRGTVTVACDRCLGALVMDVDTEFEESGYEVGKVLDLRQDVYDYVCISLPLQRVHPDGQCDPEVAGRLAG